MSVSLCMIVRDEAAALADSLESVREVVDEMVVLDTGSRDRTVDIAQAAGAQVYSFDWQDDFAAARNAALQHVTSEWVLVLDADEVLLPGVVPTLKAVMADEHCLVVNLVRQELGTNQIPYSLVSRLFRNHPDIVFERAYHESIDDSVMKILAREPHWQVLELAEMAIRHTGYLTDAIAQRQKAQRARVIMERYLETHPHDAYTCNKLGALYWEEGQREQGLELLHRGLQSEGLEPALRHELNYHLACAYSEAGAFDQAASHFQAAVEQPISPYLKLGTYTNWGNLRMQQENPVAAAVLFQKVVESDPNLAMGWFNLGTALKDMGNLEDAIACYQQAIELEPTYAQAHHGLGIAWMNGGHIFESQDSFRKAIALYQQQGDPEGDRLQKLLQEMNLL
ncbi:MAG: tetratricopeptide repeat protein [Leptolyngbyaceae cyanobacterium bins.349]|nr:tetratricopeptide repeat protein [Leptolyngbyaceae cyanobacterium bins.349]